MIPLNAKKQVVNNPINRTKSKKAYELSQVKLFLNRIKLQKKNSIKNKHTIPVVLRRKLPEKSPVETPLNVAIKKQIKNRLIITIKLIGLDFPKKLASIVSFIIFAT